MKGDATRRLIVVGLLLCSSVAARSITMAAQQPAAGAADPQALVRDGFALLDKSQLPDARKLFETAAPLARAQSNRLVEAEALRGLGTVLYQQGRWTEAAAPLERAIALYGETGDQLGQARALEQLGSAGAMTRRPDADQLYQRAAAIFAEAGLRVDQARVIRNRSHLEEVPLADKIPMLARAFELAEGDRHLQGLILHSWGSLLQTSGNYAAARERMEKAKPLLAEAGTPREMARLMASLGGSYQMHGLSERAIEVYLESLALFEKIGDLGGQSQTCTYIAEAYSTLGQSRKSLEFRERAFQLAKRTGSPGMVNVALSQLGQSYVGIGEYARAVTLMEEAIGPDDHPDVSTGFYRHLARAYDGVGRKEDAIRLATRGIDLARERGRMQVVMASLQTRAQIYQRAGQLDLALADARAGLDALEQLRTSLAPDDFLKGGFAANFQELFALSISLLDKTGHTSDAVVVAEQARARAFLDLLASNDANPDATRIGLTLRGGAGSAPQTPSATSAPVPTAATLQREAARLGSTLLSYWVADDATFVWVVDREGRVTSQRIPVTRARLRRLVRLTWSMSDTTLTARGGDPAAAADEISLPAPEPVSRAFNYVTMRGGAQLASTGQEGGAYRALYDLLIAPVRAALPGRESLITIIPHGPLFELSFAALNNENGRYLIEDYRLHYAPSAAALEFTAREKTADRNGRFLFVANPNVPANAATTPLPPLPGAEREVRAVAKALRLINPTTLTGKAASESAIRDTIGRYRVVHFATHGLVSSDRPFDSFLALASDAGARPSDGKLTAGEIYGLHLSADLVVLSACRTAGGQISGDGIVGLTRAFFAAGTPSILAALWDMADESAEVLVPRFYEEWQKSGDKSVALRAAQLSMLRDLRAGRLKVNTPFGDMSLPPHPILWANLILIGEPR